MLAPDAPITEGDFFRAFCRQADSDFKSMLQSPLFNVDLEKLATMPLLPKTPSSAAGASLVAAAQPTSHSQNGPTVESKNFTIASAHLAEFTHGAQAIIYAAARLARQQGWSVIRSPHLFAALLGEESGIAAKAVERTGVSVKKLKQAVLELVPIATASIEAPDSLSISPNVQAVFACAVRLAVTHHRAQATEQDLFDGFFVGGGGVVGELLRRGGLNIQSLPNSSGTEPDPIH
jgi:hypothetical protein